MLSPMSLGSLPANTMEFSYTSFPDLRGFILEEVVTDGWFSGMPTHVLSTPLGAYVYAQFASGGGAGNDDRMPGALRPGGAL